MGKPEMAPIKKIPLAPQLGLHCTSFGFHHPEWKFQKFVSNFKVHSSHVFANPLDPLRGATTAVGARGSSGFATLAVSK
jgi:hypothetical protein